MILRPVIVAPAMNTFMFEHPVTQPQLETIKTWGYTVLSPQVKYCLFAFMLKKIIDFILLHKLFMTLTTKSANLD